MVAIPGIPGSGGPPPKRAAQRRRTNRPGAETLGGEQVIKTAPAGAGTAPPLADEHWHPVARAWYESLAMSGQAVWYEPSDWATAVLIAESISRDLKPQVVGVHPETGEPVFATIPLKGASLAAYLKAFTALVVTEGDRRRARLELQSAAPGPDEDVPSLDDYRGRFTG